MAIDPIVSEEDRHEELSAKLHQLEYEQQERMAQRRAEEAGLPYVSLVVFPINSEVLEVIPKNKAKAAGAVLFYKQGKDFRLATVNPSVPEVKEIINELVDRFGAEPQLYVISHRSLNGALSRYRREHEEEHVPQGEVRINQEQISEFETALKNLEELGRRITSLPPTEILNAIVIGAVQVGASDIHIEPAEKEARLRFRIDGVLQDITTFNREGWALLLSRVKVLSQLKLNVREVPQDGSFVLRVSEDVYDMRLSVLPGGYGENIVMRILDRKSQAVRVTDLGMKERDFRLVTEELKKVNGMVLVTGPTGSGKTTTLASFISEINTPELKVITLEDPIEYRLPGVEQTQIDADAGYTFAKGLRSILRQDPDVIMVGEMRDAETAETAIHAALTGHLVFSTLHTNNAAGAVPRLVDIGIKPFVLGPAINMVIAQRLVRVVCKECAEEYTPTNEEKEKIVETMRGLRQDIFDPGILSSSSSKFLKAVGCSACGSTGYKGRKGVFEIFSVHGQMEELVLQGADAGRIQEEALKQGMTTIAQDGYLKVIEHITTVEEVARISEE
ncbi:MAG: GspE/PulE family protein [Candidatus Andersenbacteria bacterium]